MIVYLFVKFITGRQDAFVKLVDTMFDTMYDAPGVGLAAPQVGVQQRFFGLRGYRRLSWRQIRVGSSIAIAG